MTQALDGLTLQSPLLMIRNPFRHKRPYGLKTNFHGSNLIRRAELFHAAETKMPNQAMQRTATRCVFMFKMIKTVTVEATFALGGGSKGSYLR